jgi:hypothetical protein
MKVISFFILFFVFIYAQNQYINATVGIIQSLNVNLLNFENKGGFLQSYPTSTISQVLQGKNLELPCIDQNTGDSVDPLYIIFHQIGAVCFAQVPPNSFDVDGISCNNIPSTFQATTERYDDIKGLYITDGGSTPANVEIYILGDTIQIYGDNENANYFFGFFMSYGCGFITH